MTMPPDFHVLAYIDALVGDDQRAALHHLEAINHDGQLEQLALVAGDMLMDADVGGLPPERPAAVVLEDGRHLAFELIAALRVGDPEGARLAWDASYALDAGVAASAAVLMCFWVAWWRRGDTERFASGI